MEHDRGPFRKRPRFVIRPPTAADGEAIAALLVERGYPAAPADIPARREALTALAGADRAMVRVAELEGDVVGLITAHLVATIHAAAPVAWITALVIAPHARGVGAGRELLRHAESWASDGGAGRIAVTSGAQRADAHEFYRRIGYAETGLRFGRVL